MSEVITIGDATLYHADYRDVLPSIIVDAVICDPPYGISYRSNHNSSRRGEWANWVRDENMQGTIGDDAPFDPDPLLLLNVPTIIFGGNYCADVLPASRCWLVWDKRDGIGANNFADCELAWTNLDAPSRIFRHMWSGLLRAGEENIARSEKLHPHQKPVALMRWCVGMTKGKVFDSHMGSGTTGVGCVDLGREFVGCEIERKYFDIACERIDNAQRQQRMFA